MRHTGILCCALLLTFTLHAQWVSYSEPTGNVGAEREWLAGSAGDFYWMLKISSTRGSKRTVEVIGEWPRHYFEVYDKRLRYTRKVANQEIPYGTNKIYVIAGDRYMDLLFLTLEDSTIAIRRRRFSPEGDFLSDTLLTFYPFKEAPHRFLACRSEDRRSLLLLGFESVEDSSPNVHAILLGENGNVRSRHIYKDPSLTQPFIQDEEIEVPAENFSNSPVQLMDTGDWITILTSRTGKQFALFHFFAADSGYAVQNIQMPFRTTLEDLVLTVSNKRKMAAAGFLSRFAYRSLKNVQVVQYDILKRKMRLDTSYRFNALLSDKVNTKSIVKERLATVPGAGFVLLREYGRTIDQLYDGMNLPEKSGNELIADIGLSTNEEAVIRNRDNYYFRSGRLGGMQREPERGDLSIFYFPAIPGDSCWSGLITKPQFTESNSPYLSYLMIPYEGKLHILNNDFYSPWKQYGISTVLDKQGKRYEGEGTVFWRYQNILLFQQAAYLRANEIGVPYRVNERTGFSIIRF